MNLTFKAYHKENKELLDVERIYFSDEIVFLRRETERSTTWFEEDFKNVEILQSTGLKDKNGVEIFQGYVVKGHTLINGKNYRIIGKVEYVGTSFKVREINKHEGFLEPLNGNFEVLGNIYEDKEFSGDEQNGNKV